MLVVCCSPCSSNLSESLSTLRFGQRAKQMKNKPVVNRVRSVEELERLLSKVRTVVMAALNFVHTIVKLPTPPPLLPITRAGRDGN